MQATNQHVSRQDIERLLNLVRDRTADPRAGIFGPSSISWRVNRESALFLGAGRAALLQLAHPWVAAALDRHSNLRADPIARFHNTFRVVFSMVFGSLEQALAASQYVYELHTRIEGELPEAVADYLQGSRYEANEVNALVWVFSTLIESAVQAYDCVLPPLSRDERDAYYAESKTLAALFGIPPEALPPDWLEFEAYNREMLSSRLLGASAASRETAHWLLRGSGTRVPVPSWYRSLTIANLPERLREEFHLSHTKQEAAMAERARYWLLCTYRRIPEIVRFVGPYNEAISRLAARPPNAIARLKNRFWIGQTRMMFGPSD